MILKKTKIPIFDLSKQVMKSKKKFTTIFFTTKNYLRLKSFRFILPFYRLFVFLLGRPSYTLETQGEDTF